MARQDDDSAQDCTSHATPRAPSVTAPATDADADARRIRRARLGRAGALAIVIAAGLGSRRFGDALPGFVAAYAGDALWATAAFLALGIAAPRASLLSRALLALAISFAVECSQLYRATWIDAIRRTLPGRLLLGSGFIASDLACYAAGVALGVTGELLARVLRVAARDGSATVRRTPRGTPARPRNDAA